MNFGPDRVNEGKKIVPVGDRGLWAMIFLKRLWNYHIFLKRICNQHMTKKVIPVVDSGL